MKTGLILLFISFFTASICTAQSNVKEEKVYITKSGTKYHKAGCSYLKGGGTEMDLKEASSKYSPCSRCFKSTNTDSTSDQQGISDSKPKSTGTSNSEVGSGKTNSDATIHTGPRGGKYHYSKSGKKVYERKK